jgi:hypothetical protein
MSSEAVPWLLEGDPSVRWQTFASLCGAGPRAVERERARVAREGWGARLLALQDAGGTWARGLYSPKWTSTTYTLLLLRDLGLAAGNRQALEGCRLLLDAGAYEDGGINLWRKTYRHSETCVTGMVLSFCAFFKTGGERLAALVEYLLREQMPDGGWNCLRPHGATHASFHTTILVLEGLLEYEKQNARVREAQDRGREFLLRHRLFRSHRTGAVVDPVLTRFHFPARWHYDVLRALDYFRASNAPPDPRLEDAIALVRKRARSDGRWSLSSHYPGRVFFELEKPGEPSRWNTLRALRVLQWWEETGSTTSKRCLAASR